jgi:replicative DNA helicase
MEGLPERPVPYNVEAERSVLGAIFIHRDAIISVAAWLHPEDFYREAHAWIYEAQLACYARREPPDLITVAAALEQRGRLEDVGGNAYLTALVQSVPTAMHVEYYGRIVERCAVLRRLIAAGGQIAAIGYETPEDVDEGLSRAEELIFAISQRRVTRDFIPLKEVTSEYFDRLSRLRAIHGEVIGVPTGFRDLDSILGGLQRSDLVILAARPTAGKTSLALTIAYNAGVQQGIPVGLFSLEMSREQLVQRLLAIDTGLDSQRLRRGMLNDEEFQRVSESMGGLAEAPIFLDDTPSTPINEMRSKARRLQAEQAVELIIVDYLQLIQGRRTENRVQEISEISRSLKGLARELDVPVLALSQLSRAVEHRSPHIPVLADLRDSGSIEQDADVVMFIYREEMYDVDTDKPGIAEIIVAKHRNGPTGKTYLRFFQETTRFGDLERFRESEPGGLP